LELQEAIDSIDAAEPMYGVVKNISVNSDK
jgi:hypothetical protein